MSFFCAVKTSKKQGECSTRRSHVKSTHYWSGPLVLNFCDRTGTGVSTRVWPHSFRVLVWKSINWILSMYIHMRELGWEWTNLSSVELFNALQRSFSTFSTQNFNFSSEETLKFEYSKKSSKWVWWIFDFFPYSKGISIWYFFSYCIFLLYFFALKRHFYLIFFSHRIFLIRYSFFYSKGISISYFSYLFFFYFEEDISIWYLSAIIFFFLYIFLHAKGIFISKIFPRVLFFIRKAFLFHIFQLSHFSHAFFRIQNAFLFDIFERA